MAVEVVRKDDGKLVAYACPGCGQLYQIIPTPDEKAGVERSSTLANDCCPPRTCPQCNQNPVPRGSPICASCAVEADKRAEEQRYEAATKVREQDWRGPIYWPSATFDGDHGDRYWSSVAALRRDINQRNAQRATATPRLPPIVPPTYVYATKPIPFRLDALAALEQALEDHAEDAADKISDEELKRLQRFLDDWAKKQGISSYEEDLERVVVLG